MDGMAAVGLILVAGGLWMIWPPLAFIVVGALLIVFAMWIARRGS
jgi:hypothetical protein